MEKEPNVTRLLVLEDEPLIAAMLAEWLHQQGFIVEALAHTLPHALRAAAYAPLDGAILDIRVRDGPSYPVAANLRQRNIPFVFATGMAMKGIDAGFQNEVIVSKPFEFDVLDRHLKAIVKPPAVSPARGGLREERLAVAAGPQAR
jgi:DNA-binding response OmpR family regulator